jgi:hypothetical protein
VEVIFQLALSEIGQALEFMLLTGLQQAEGTDHPKAGRLDRSELDGARLLAFAAAFFAYERPCQGWGVTA